MRRSYPIRFVAFAARLVLTGIVWASYASVAPAEEAGPLAYGQEPHGGTTVFEEHFDGPCLPSTMTYFADPSIRQWIIDESGRLYADRFDYGFIPMAAVSWQTFPCGTYRYSADMGRPSISVNPSVPTTPGGSGTGLLFGQWVVYFGPGNPNGNLKLGLWVPSQNHPTVLVEEPLGFTPTFDAMHHVEAVVTTLESGGTRIEVAISGLGDDGQQHTFGFSYASTLGLGTGRAGVFLNRLNMDDAYYDNLLVEQISFEDSDGDGVCDSADVCQGHNDAVDPDGDGVPTGCDLCPFDYPDDADSDGVCDWNDACLGFDDNADADGDGLPDGCDPCAGDAGGGDADANGSVDLNDYTRLESCLLGPGGGLGAGCECLDQDEDDDVDLSDLARFQAQFTE